MGSNIQIVRNPQPPRPSSVESGLLPFEQNNTKWFYIQPVEGWEFIEAHGFVPTLSEQQVKPGCNGVQEVMDSAGRVIGVDDSRLRAGLIRKGTAVFDPNDARLGPWRNYLRAYPCVGGGKRWVFYTDDEGGVEFELLPNGRAIASAADVALMKFKLYLRDNNLCNALSSSTYRKLLEVEQRGYNRLLKEAGNNPHKAPALEAKRARIEAMEAAWARLQDAAATPAAIAKPRKPAKLAAPEVA